MKKILIIALILFLILSAGVIYLNQVILPQKIKAIIISSLKKQTGKDVTLKSLEFSLFSGLIVRDLVVTDNQNVILSTRQATCSIFIWPIFRKQIVIPSITLKSPYIFLQRRQDKTFNLQDLIFPASSPDKKSDFNVSVFKIKVTNGYIVFQDDTLSAKFKKEIKNIQFNLHLGLPASVKFNFKGEIQDNPLVFVAASGQYKILAKELISYITVKNLSVQEFKAYYSEFGDLVSGLIDMEGQVKLKDSLLKVEITAKGNDLVLEKDKLKAKLTSVLDAHIDYGLDTKKISFKGSCDILKADILGAPIVGDIKNLHGKFAFSQRSLVADSLKAELLGKQFEVELGIKDFNTPVLSINTDLDLSALPNILKDKFKFSLVNSASGRAALNIKTHPDKSGAWVVQGNMGINGATLKLDKQDIPVENIFAKLGFSQNGLNWENAKFKYQGIDYESSGSLDNFITPTVKLTLDSSDLSLTGNLNLSGKKLKISQLKGKYINSQFLLSGDIDNADPSKTAVDLSGKISLDMNNLNKLLEKKYPAIKDMKLSGQIDCQFNLSGSPADFRNCYLKAKLIGNNFSLYGLKTQSLSMELFQDQKIAKIASLRVGFYDGSIEGSGAINLDTSGFSYQLVIEANGIKLEKLKMDTVSKNKNIAGVFVGEVKLSGFIAEPAKLGGSGSFSVKEGKLWELNLLQGIGKLLFARDLANINISECSSNFLVKDKFIYTDSLKLRSNIANLTGPMKIGFDNSLEGSLDVEILSDMVPVSGTLKDLTTALVGTAGKFGVIKLSGTLKEPKYSFRPAVGNLIKGLTDVIFGKPK
ncbi:MAG: AsmA family protein [Candidatus Omnitrophota bacterium]